MNERYRRSTELLHRAREVIPLGSQTFSKSFVQYPAGAAPLFLERGRGARVWDVDGNEYVDFVMGLLSVSLGYGDPDVTAAVQAQLESGVTFSLPHPLETEVAEAIVRLVPCAAQVRFAKNGSDVTTAAVRLARASTGRERVAVCGYHGWQDWYIGSTSRSQGVPGAVRALTHAFPYNDAAALAQLLERHEGEFAAIILEPMNTTFPAAGFLEGVRDLAHEHGAVLIFDETITGFRFARGGAQERFGVVPDLATFGKGLANGFPLAALAGPRELMMQLEEVFFSTTFGGEALSLAAARAVLRKIQGEPVLETLEARGRELAQEVSGLLERHGVAPWIRLAGHPTWTFLLFQDAGAFSSFELKTLFLQEVLARGILTHGTHNLCLAHGDAELARLYAVYDEVFPLLHEAVTQGTLRERLRCEPLEPLFRVR